MAILIASYSRDISYLSWCLKSVEKFATGFTGVTVVVPEDEAKMFKKLTENLKTYQRIQDQSKWQLHAQVQKCMADFYCPNADFVLHMDSDCIFKESVTPKDYLARGKPVMVIKEYSRLQGSPWKAVTERALGFPVAYETMQRHPQVNPIGIYSDMRKHIESVHHQLFEDYVLCGSGGFPFSFSEHNCIGAFALSRPEWRDKYHWIDSAKNPRPKEKVKQFWSLSPIEKPQGTPHDHDTIIPLKICQEVIGQ